MATGLAIEKRTCMPQAVLLMLSAFKLPAVVVQWLLTCISMIFWIQRPQFSQESLSNLHTESHTEIELLELRLVA